jgi:hypothetical protein
LVIPFGPGDPKTHSTEPKKDPFHVQLFEELSIKCGTFKRMGTTYHYSEEVIAEAILVNMVAPRLAVLVEREFE